MVDSCTTKAATRINVEPIAAATTHSVYLDGWRGIAIALVLEAHFFSFLPFGFPDEWCFVLATPEIEQIL